MDCSICYDEITQATGKVELSCSHSFHFSCLTSWFKTQTGNELTQSCPCCRHESNEHEKMATERPVEDEDEDEDDDDDESEESEELTEEEELALAAAKERAALRFQKLKAELSKEAFEAYAASKIAAMFRMACARYNFNDIMSIKDNMLTRACELIRKNNCQRLDRKSLAFNMQCLTMPHMAWRNKVATIVQVWWRAKWQKIKPQENSEAGRWRLSSHGRWHRVVANGDSVSVTIQ
jgi:hypothetical protein